MDGELKEAIDLFKSLIKEADKGIVGLDEVKRITAIALFSEIHTTWSAEKSRRVNSGLVWLMGVPGTGKTYFGLVFAAATNTVFGRLQGRADLVPSDILGAGIYNPKTGNFETHPGPIVKASVFLIDELNRTPPKSQSAFLEALQDRTVTIGDTVYQLPEFNFYLATTNPVETGEGTFHVSEAAADRFTFQINVDYLPPDEEQKLTDFDFKSVEINPIADPLRIVALRSVISDKVFIHKAIKKYIRRLVVASRPPEQDSLPREARYISYLQSFALSVYDLKKQLKDREPAIKYWKKITVPGESPSSLVNEFVELGASPRATICWGPTAKVRALLIGERKEVYPEDIQALAKHILGHRIHLKPNARSKGVTVNDVIEEIIEKVPIP